MKANYIITTNKEVEKVNAIVKDKLTEFGNWIDDNEELLQKSDYGIQFFFTEDNTVEDTTHLDGRVFMDELTQLDVIESVLVDMYLNTCEASYIAPKDFLGMIKDDFYAELSHRHPTKKSKNNNKQKGQE